MAIPPPSAEHPANPAAFRAALRQEKLTARAGLGMHQPELHAAHSARIAHHLAAWCATQAPTSIGFCAPVRGEFDARPLITRLLEQGWQAAMPVVHQLDAPMRFHPWTPATPMTRDRHGIPIPANAPGPEPRILWLPLVAFDTAGYRLGYGGGYFDRTLAASVPSPITIGIGFELARVVTIYPQTHDQKLDFVVTEAGVTDCNA